jgi:hypothetical protein
LYSKLSTAEKQDKEIKKWNKDISNMSVEWDLEIWPYCYHFQY